MSTTEGGGRINTDGLVLYLDGRNSKSLISGTTRWNDLSILTNNTTLVNNPIYSPTFGGGVTFNTVNQYGLIAAPGQQLTSWNSNWANSNSMSVCFWITTNWTGTGARRDGIIGQQYFTGTGFGGFDIHSNASAPCVLALTLNGQFRQVNTITWSNYTNLPVFFAFSHNGSVNNFRTFVNGGFQNLAPGFTVPLGSYMQDATNQLRIARINGDTSDFPKTIHQMYVYNRAISDIEILSIYNHTKANFGL